MKRVLEFHITKSDDGKTVNDFLRHEIHVSGSLIKQMKMRDDGIILNGERVFVNRKMNEGDSLSIMVGFDDESSDNIVATNTPIDIIYEDDDLLVVNKPPKMPTHPSLYHYEDSLANAVVSHYKAQGKTMIFRAVNRLDKDTSGLCVIAKHAYAQEILKHELHTDEFVREYVAICLGRTENQGYVEKPIRREQDSVIKRTVADDGDYAYTSYKTIRHIGDLSLVSLILKTGRTHQIRVHMSSIGHPLLGDFLYGTESDLINRTALHSSIISLIHPVTSERICFNAPLPTDMQAVLNSAK